MTWSECIIAAHTAVTDQVSHGGRMKSKRYFVWQESKPRDLIADGIHCERIHRGSTSLYTPLEFDPWADQFEQSLNSRSNIAWSCEGKWPDEGNTRIWHYEWKWEVVENGEDHSTESI
jgi:hypothetical protein